MKLWRGILDGMGLLSILTSVAQAQIATYNLVSGFSSTTNPSGVWSYGETTSGGSSFGIFSSYSSFFSNTTEGWAGQCFGFRGTTVCAPFVAYNDGTQVYNWGDVGEPLLRLGRWLDMPELPCLRFTAPDTGIYSIRITARCSIANLDNIVIRTNGQPLLEATFPASADIRYTNSMNLVAGDIIDFVGSTYTEFTTNRSSHLYLSGSVTRDSAPTQSTLMWVPPGGTFTNSIGVALQTSSASGVVRYTSDGSNPTVASAAYTGPFTLTSSATLKAQLYTNGIAATGIASATFTRYTPPPDIAFSPPGGLFYDSVNVTLVNNVGAGGIRYTFDGSEPTPSSTLYAGPIQLTLNATIKAGVFFNQFPVSVVFAQTYQRSYVSPEDGIPDSWRTLYFGPNFASNPQAAANADPDADGSTNAEEYGAGTNPTDPLSGFKATVTTVPRVNFPSVAGQSYRVLRMQTLGNPPTLLATVQATSAQTSYIDQSPGTASFYIIEVVPVP